MTNTVEPITDEDRAKIRKGQQPEGFECYPVTSSNLDGWLIAHAYEARLSAADEENKRLREALKPFYADRDYCPHLDGPVSDACHAGTVGPFEINMGHLRAVRNALRKGKEDDPNRNR